MPISQGDLQDVQGSVSVIGEGSAGTPTGGVLTVQGPNTNGSILIREADVVVSGTLTALGQTLVATCNGGESTWSVDLRGNSNGWTANTNIVFEYTVDGTNYLTAYGVQQNADLGTPNNGTSGPTPISFQGSIAGCSAFRVRVFAYNGPDQVVATIRLSYADSIIAYRTAIPTGTNNIGSIANITGTISLPTGAATSANQTTEITSLQLIDNPIGALSGGTAGTSSFAAGAVYNSTPLTLTNGQQASLQSTPTAQLLTADLIGISSQYRAQSVTTTAAQALGGATALANRKFIQITPTNGTIYYGTSSSVTTATGSPLFANQTLTLSFTTTVQLWVIAAATVDTRVLEGS